MDKEIEKIVQRLKGDKKPPKKEGRIRKKIKGLFSFLNKNWTRIFSAACILTVAGIGFVLWNVIKLPTTTDVGVFSLTVALISLLISFANFFLEGIRRKERFIIHKLSNDKRIEVFIIKLQDKAKNENIEIYNIDLFKHKNEAYLKIFY